jgi:hypothetical protein
MENILKDRSNNFKLMMQIQKFSQDLTLEEISQVREFKRRN